MLLTNIISRLTIFFDDPYWVGILELETEGKLFVSRYIFGAEPSDQEIWLFVQREVPALQTRRTFGVAFSTTPDHPANFKRMQRESRHAIEREGVTSKAREAMRLQIEQDKQVRQGTSREQRDARRAYQREVAREKAKARHRGR